MSEGSLFVFDPKKHALCVSIDKLPHRPHVEDVFVVYVSVVYVNDTTECITIPVKGATLGHRDVIHKTQYNLTITVTVYPEYVMWDQMFRVTAVVNTTDAYAWRMTLTNAAQCVLRFNVASSIDMTSVTSYNTNATDEKHAHGPCPITEGDGTYDPLGVFQPYLGPPPHQDPPTASAKPENMSKGPLVIDPKVDMLIFTFMQSGEDMTRVRNTITLDIANCSKAYTFYYHTYKDEVVIENQPWQNMVVSIRYMKKKMQYRVHVEFQTGERYKWNLLAVSGHRYILHFDEDHVLPPKKQNEHDNDTVAKTPLTSLAVETVFDPIYKALAETMSNVSQDTAPTVFAQWIGSFEEVMRLEEKWRDMRGDASAKGTFGGGGDDDE